MNRDAMIKILSRAVSELDAARKDVTTQTAPHTPTPRPRFFTIVPDVTWPRCIGDSVDWTTFKIDKNSFMYLSSHGAVAEDICRRCGWQPRKVLRALRRIQAATAWCRARAEGRQRAAQEILRQQRQYVEILEAERILQRLT